MSCKRPSRGHVTLNCAFLHELIVSLSLLFSYYRLFETHPECKDVFFLFRDVEDLERLRSSRELRAHGLRSVGDSDSVNMRRELSAEGTGHTETGLDTKVKHVERT